MKINGLVIPHIVYVKATNNVYINLNNLLKKTKLFFLQKIPVNKILFYYEKLLIGNTMYSQALTLI